MSGTWQFLFGVLVSFMVNECCEVSPWCARRLVRLAAQMRYADPNRRQIRADELVALINERPGKLLKLLTGLGFASAAIPAWLHRAVHGALRRLTRISRRPPADHAAFTVTDPWDLPPKIGRVSTRLAHLGDTGGVLTVRGRWGTGKTTVTNHVLTGLEQRWVVQYNPWMDESVDSDRHPLEGLAAAVRSSHPELADVAAAIDRVVEIPTSKMGLGRLAIRRAVRRLARALRGLPQPILISLDDLDRMMPEPIREVLKVVARTRNLPRLVWLMAFDPSVIRPQIPNVLYTDSIGKDHITLAYGTLRRRGP